MRTGYETHTHQPHNKERNRKRLPKVLDLLNRLFMVDKDLPVRRVKDKGKASKVVRNRRKAVKAARRKNR